jgi:hypothetical protein
VDRTPAGLRSIIVVILFAIVIVVIVVVFIIVIIVIIVIWSRRSGWRCGCRCARSRRWRY